MIAEIYILTTLLEDKSISANFQAQTVFVRILLQTKKYFSCIYV